MFKDEQYNYQAYVPVGVTNPCEPAKKGRPIDSKNYNSQSAQTAAAAVSALSRSMMYLNSVYTLPHTVYQGIRAIRLQIDDLIPPVGGVLVVVREGRNSEGLVSFDLAWIAGAGKDPGTVFDQWRHTPELVRTLPRRYDPIFEFYWATPRAGWTAINASA